jgi:hypothetical protein
MKLNQIKLRSFIEDLSDQDVFKCLGVTIYIILEKYHDPDSVKFLKSWCSDMANKANRHIFKVKKRIGKCCSNLQGFQNLEGL